MDRRIDEKYRNPRRAKRTPYFVHRNYYALGVLFFGGLSWYIYELWPSSKKLIALQEAGKLDPPQDLQTKIKHIQISRTDASMDELLPKAREREFIKANEQQAKPEPWFIKLLR